MPCPQLLWHNVCRVRRTPDACFSASLRGNRLGLRSAHCVGRDGSANADCRTDSTQPRRRDQVSCTEMPGTRPVRPQRQRENPDHDKPPPHRYSAGRCAGAGPLRLQGGLERRARPRRSPNRRPRPRRRPRRNLRPTAADEPNATVEPAPAQEPEATESAVGPPPTFRNELEATDPLTVALGAGRPQANRVFRSLVTGLR